MNETRSGRKTITYPIDNPFELFNVLVFETPDIREVRTPKCKATYIRVKSMFYDSFLEKVADSLHDHGCGYMLATKSENACYIFLYTPVGLDVRVLDDMLPVLEYHTFTRPFMKKIKLAMNRMDDRYKEEHCEANVVSREGYKMYYYTPGHF